MRKKIHPRNTHKNNFGPTKYPREKNLNLRNTHEKKFGTHRETRNNYPQVTISEPREKISHPRNTQEGTMALDPRDLTHSFQYEKAAVRADILQNRYS